MRTVTAVVVFFACAAVTAGADEKSAKFTSKDGKYAVAFPAGAKLKTSKQDVGNGLSISTTSVESGGKAYSVMFMSFPDAVKNVPAKTILDGAEKGAVEKSGGKLIKSKELEFGEAKHPGRDVLLEKDGNKVRTWIIFTPARMYVIVVGGMMDFAAGKEAQAFLDSFELTK